MIGGILSFLTVAVCSGSGMQQSILPENSSLSQTIESYASENETEENINAEKEEVDVDNLVIVSEETVEEQLEKTRMSLPNSAQITTEPILQNPELPTGCESVALTMALNSLGFHLDKTTIADQYLIYSSTSMVSGYMGNPRTSNGAGIFPPGLVNTSDTFLKQNQSDLNAYNTSGTAMQELYAYLAIGAPVVIWTTMYFEEPMMSDIYETYNGVDYRWYWNEHCVVLTGYDVSQDTVQVYDPLQGFLTLGRAELEYTYDVSGRYSMTIY